MEKYWNRPGGRTEQNQASALAAMAALTVLGLGSALVPAFCLLCRNRIAPSWAALALALPFLAGSLWYRRWRRQGGLAGFSSFKLFLVGAAALTASGLLTGLCVLGRLLVIIPAFFLGACGACFWEVFRNLFGNFKLFSRAFPKENGKMLLNVALWTVIMLCAFLLPGWRTVPGWVLHLMAALLPGLCICAAQVILGRRCCLSDQRGRELRRELPENP